MSAAEISTVEEAAAFFAEMAKLHPGYRVVMMTPDEDGDLAVSGVVSRFALNLANKRIEIEVEP